MAEKVVTPAGVKIKGIARVDFSGGRSFSNPIETVVPQIYGITLSPLNLYSTVLKSQAYYFPHHVENVGNGTDIISFKVDGLNKGWQARFIIDENGNGIHEESETEAIKDSLKLSEGGKISFFLEVSTQQHLQTGSTSNVTIRLSSSGSDGPAYTGSNGNIYGGDDALSTTDRVLLL